jgi:hypothetical protein
MSGPFEKERVVSFSRLLLDDAANLFGAVATILFVVQAALFRFDIVGVIVTAVGVSIIVISSTLMSPSRRSNVTNPRDMSRNHDETTWLSLLTNRTPLNHTPVFNVGSRVQPRSTTFASRSSHHGFCDVHYCSCGHGRLGAYTPRVTTCSIEGDVIGNISARRRSSGREGQRS